MEYIEVSNVSFNVPQEILMVVFSFLEAGHLSHSIMLVSKQWNKMGKHNSLWKKLYKKKWFTSKIIELQRTWREIYRDRLAVETQHLETKREEIEKREQEEIAKTKGKAERDYFTLYRHSKYLVFGDNLKDKMDTFSEESKLLLMLVANEEYATCNALNPKNYIGLFNWGHLLVHLAKTLLNLKNPAYEDVFMSAFQKYDQAMKLKINLIKEDTLSRWGDALHDYAKTKKTRADVEEWLEKSYEKYSQSVEIMPTFIAYDFWGLTLYTHAKLKKNDEKESDRFYAEAVEKYEKAHELKPEDGYVLCHWAGTLQNQAAQKEGADSRRIYSEAFTRFQQSAALLPEDAFTIRSWGDALHEYSKKLIQEAEETDCPPEKKEELLKEACEILEQASEKFDSANKQRSDYTNAMNNWGLSLSTHAKVLSYEKSEEYFKEAYEKFEKALQMTTTDQSFIICNWAMTMVSQARKRSLCGENVDDLLEEAREKLDNQVEKGDTWALFCMARWCSVANKADECRIWLEKFQVSDNYLPRATRGQMSYFKNVQHYPWFNEIVMKAKEESRESIDFS